MNSGWVFAGEDRMGGLTAALNCLVNATLAAVLSRGGRMYASGDDVVNNSFHGFDVSIPFPITFRQTIMLRYSVGGGVRGWPKKWTR